MSKPEFPVDARGKGTFVSWLQVIAGTILLLIVATVAYAVLLTLSAVLPTSILDRFPFVSGDFFRIAVTSAMGMWFGTAALKFVFPRVKRGAVFAIVGSLMVLAFLASTVLMWIRGTTDGWESVLSSIVFFLVAAAVLRGRDWDYLPGRQPR